MERELLIAWLRERIAELEEELGYYRGLLGALGGWDGNGDPRRPRPGERVEEVGAGRRRIARVFKGESHARMVPLERMALPPEAREYLEGVVAELRAEQARLGREDRLAALRIRESPSEGLLEVVIENLNNALEVIKAKAALKHAAEVAWMYTRAAMKSGGD